MVREHLDGVIVVGFTVQGEGIMVQQCKDAKTAMALNTWLVNLMASGGARLKERKREDE